jgi:hypothetical protein
MNRALVVVLAAILLALLVGPVYAQTGGGYDLSWNVAGAGGGETFALGGGYELGSTVGQAAAGVMTGGGYTLLAGFWGAVAGATWRIHLPLVVR